MQINFNLTEKQAVALLDCIVYLDTETETIIEDAVLKARQREIAPDNDPMDMEP